MKNDAEKVIDSSLANVVEFHQQAITPAAQGEKTVTLIYKGLNKKGNAAIYTGARSTIRFALVNFEGKVAPDTLEVSSLLTSVPKEVKLTAEERKAARAARPKPTLAERAARAQKRADKLAAAAAEVSQPSM